MKPFGRIKRIYGNIDHRRCAMKRLLAPLCAGLMALATPTLAEYQQVNTKADFVALVTGKSLTRPLVKLQVLPNGQISGFGAAWEITGKWQWKAGYLCRSIEWGGDDLGYNCQTVEADGNKMRITSDKGSGDSAEFKLR
tara:strand:+ start:1663 stop:2079 length:417 start_codon:yes stop_codon:yes gene_type:complete